MKKILASLCTIFLFSNIVTSAKAEINFLIGTWAEEPLTPFVEAFEKETGIEVNIQTFPFRDLLATIEVRGNAQADDVDVIFVDAPAVDDLINKANAGSKEDPLYVIAIGAISNVSSALLKAPEIKDKIVVVWLGGNALYWPHSYDYNLKQDVGGTQVLFDCGVPLVMVPCAGVTTHLTSTVPEVEKYIEPHGEIGKFLAMRFKEYSDDHKCWSKELWDMAAVAWVLDEKWTPTNLIPSPVLSDNMTWSVDQRRHPIKIVSMLNRDVILKDFVEKLEKFNS